MRAWTGLDPSASPPPPSKVPIARVPTPPTGGEEAHVATMRERLRMHDQQVLKEVAQLVRDFEEEMLAIGDFGEFSDVAEILQEVLQMAPSADAFLANARGGP